jgi:hypothetical protein
MLQTHAIQPMLGYAPAQRLSAAAVIGFALNVVTLSAFVAGLIFLAARVPGADLSSAAPSRRWVADTVLASLAALEGGCALVSLVALRLIRRNSLVLRGEALARASLIMALFGMAAIALTWGWIELSGVLR